MAYTVHNFKTKKALKEAVEAWNKFSSVEPTDPKPICCYNPGLGPDLSNYTGTISLEGPHSPRPHTWYVTGRMKDGVVVKVT